MDILTAQQVKAWDKYTIQHEPISSIDLMERAAMRCFDWIAAQIGKKNGFKIFCGKGNNGGDGLALTRLLLENGYLVSVYILESGKTGTDDFQTNLQRLHDLNFHDIFFLHAKENFPLINTNDILIDALVGSGLNRPLENLVAELVDHINHSKALVISIDLPSGLFVDQSSKGNKIIEARHILSFQCFKTGLLIQENAEYIGEVHILDIGLHPGFLQTEKFTTHIVDQNLIKQIFKPRNDFAHKGNFGHALLIAGSYGKMGAAVLSAKACLHSGVGLLTCYFPSSGYDIMQTSVPEAMALVDENEKNVAQLPNEIDNYSVIGIGPGIGTANETQNLISFITRRYQKPLVIDADGLNCIALQPGLLHQLPPFSILTPHLKEFDRLFGEHQNDFERIATAREKAKELTVVIILKSHHTMIAMPGGNLFFNNTGNAGMAKGGSGDVLTGILTALIAQNYPSEQAAIFGVYIHGLAGDYAAKNLSREALIASDIVDCLSQAFLEISKRN